MWFLSKDSSSRCLDNKGCLKLSKLMQWFLKKHIFTCYSTSFQCCVPVNPLAEGTIQQYLQISVAATPCQIPHMPISEKTTLLLYFPGSFFHNYPNNPLVRLTKLRFWLFFSISVFSTLQIKQRLGTLQISLGWGVLEQSVKICAWPQWREKWCRKSQRDQSFSSHFQQPFFLHVDSEAHLPCRQKASSCCGGKQHNTIICPGKVRKSHNIHTLLA